jgi:hypothetical protein
VASGRNMQDLGDIAVTLQKIMSFLRCWSRDKFRVVTKELATIRESLEALSLQGSVANQVKLSELAKRMDKLLYREEMMWLQRSRVAWLKESDHNTKYFHKKAAGRAKKNKIKSCVERIGTPRRTRGRWRIWPGNFSRSFIQQT